MKVDKTAGKPTTGRRHAEARGAEPQPADVRRRRLAVRRRSSASWRSRPSNFLGRGESLTAVAAGGRSRAQNYQLGVHRAVPVRSPHHRRRRHLQAVAAVHRPVHAEVDRRQPDVRASRSPTSPHVHQLLVRAGADDRPQRGAARPARASSACRGCSTCSSLSDLSQLIGVAARSASAATRSCPTRC